MHLCDIVVVLSVIMKGVYCNLGSVALLTWQVVVFIPQSRWSLTAFGSSGGTAVGFHLFSMGN